MKWVYLVAGEVQDRSQVDPYTIFTPEYAKQFIEAPDYVDHGWRLDGSTWIEPVPILPPVIPVTVTPLQASIAMMQAGKLDELNAYMASESVDPIAKLAWEKATSFVRDSPLLLQIASELGWSEQELDELFDAASLITV